MKTATPPRKTHPHRASNFRKPTTSATARKPLPTAWCRGCNRALPRVKRGVCTRCHRTFNRSDWSSFRREPAEEARQSHATAALFALSAAAVYALWHVVDGYVAAAIWHSQQAWPIGGLLIVSLRTWLVTLLTLCALRHTHYDRLILLWPAGIVLGGLLAWPHGSTALLVGLIVGASAAITARGMSLGLVMRHGV